MTVQVLYKYGSFNGYSEALFSTPEIRFSSPSELNDPFECCPWLTFNGTQNQLIEFHKRELWKRNPQLTPENAAAHAGSNFLDGRHRDPDTLNRIRKRVHTMLARRIGLYCLSENNDSILMWSHYSHNHQGYCLEFEATNFTPVFGEAQRVNYASDYPVVDFFNTPNEEQVDLIFLTKYIGWSYEEEWRIIDHEAGPGAHAYPAELLRGVIFGLRMPEDERAKIRAWTKKRGHSVKFHEAIQSDRRFKIDVREVE